MDSYKLGLNNIVKSNWLNSKSKFRAIQNSVEKETVFWLIMVWSDQNKCNYVINRVMAAIYKV